MTSSNLNIDRNHYKRPSQRGFVKNSEIVTGFKTLSVKFQPLREKGKPNGYVPLNQNGKISFQYLPRHLVTTSARGSAHGCCPLDSNGKVPLEYLTIGAPFSVDDMCKRTVTKMGSAIQVNSATKTLVPFQQITGGNLLDTISTPGVIVIPHDGTYQFQFTGNYTESDDSAGTQRHFWFEAANGDLGIGYTPVVFGKAVYPSGDNVGMGVCAVRFSTESTMTLRAGMEVRLYHYHDADVVRTLSDMYSTLTIKKM